MPKSPEVSIASALRFAEALPHVLADPTQVHDGRVWASVHDALPGAVLRNGSLVVAAWGSLTWTARAEWDARDHQVLWLHPVQLPKARPSVRRTYDVDALAEAVVLAVADLPDAASHAAREATRRAVVDVVGPLVEDFEEVLQHHHIGMDAHRLMIADALRYLENTGPTKAIRRFLNSVPGCDLMRLARYYRPPTP